MSSTRLPRLTRSRFKLRSQLLSSAPLPFPTPHDDQSSIQYTTTSSTPTPSQPSKPPPPPHLVDRDVNLHSPPKTDASSAPPEAEPPSKAPNSSASTVAQLHPKKRRKTSPPPSITPVRPPPLERSNSATVARTATTATGANTPTTGNGAVASSSKTKVSTSNRQHQAGSTVPPTKSGRAALIVRTVNQAVSRAGSQHVVDDDSPLPAPPRAGMGEGLHEQPKESAVREEALLRREAQYIIDAAESHRREVDKRRESETDDLGKRTRRPVDHTNGISNGEITNGKGNGNGHDNQPGPSSTTRRNRNRNESITNPRPESFEAQFAAVQNSYKAAEAAHRTAIQGQGQGGRHPHPSTPLGPMVYQDDRTFGPNGQSQAAQWFDNGYGDGMDGLSIQMERDAQGFVNNVKENLKQMMKFYFPEDSARKDAYCERIGRGLQQLGWELTDNADAALLP
ncbi:hypothetical protein CI109_105149 [Kwoniella shandongensis]|uniref:Uncharacterized protein n=1 Tax=Kwoniella shandongensis TaxID=1734106 RepID=A0A5M6C3N3_9TREE|nr:uncharacterized protein CI109_001988 [Kwoniella shandongensis]KAA5529563.1 hypothetical protein CI109_001988 [Kwoniella shandongensis]